MKRDTDLRQTLRRVRRDLSEFFQRARKAAERIDGLTLRAALRVDRALRATDRRRK